MLEKNALQEIILNRVFCGINFSRNCVVGQIVVKITIFIYHTFEISRTRFGI